MVTILICIIGIIVILILADGLSKYQKNSIEKAMEPLEKIEKEYLDKLKSWCNSNNVVFNENIFSTKEYLFNGLTPGYIWFDNKDFIFCPDSINCGMPININENIVWIKYNNIKYYTKDGSISYTNEITNTGKNISLSGAVIGGLLAGDVGAIVGSRKDMNKLKNNTIRHDDTHTYICYNENEEIKLAVVKGNEFYNTIQQSIPEMEYNYLLYKKNLD